MRVELEPDPGTKPPICNRQILKMVILGHEDKSFMLAVAVGIDMGKDPERQRDFYRVDALVVDQVVEVEVAFVGVDKVFLLDGNNWQEVLSVDGLVLESGQSIVLLAVFALVDLELN